MLNVLVTGRAIPQQPKTCTGQQLAEGFQQAGHNAIFYGNFYNTHNWLGYKELQEANRIDLWVYTEMNDGNPQYNQLFNYYKLKDTPKIYWDFDVSYGPERNLSFAKSLPFDAFCVANRLFVERFNEIKPSLFLPYGFSPQLHRRLELKPLVNTYMYGFIGSMTPERLRLIEIIKENSSYDVLVKDGVFGEQLVYETNRISIMLHRQQGGCKGLCPGRPFESLGAGTLLLTHIEDAADIRPVLPGVPFFTYSSEQSLIKLIEALEPERDGDPVGKLRLRAEKIMKERHTYRHRAESIIKFARSQGLL